MKKPYLKPDFIGSGYIRQTAKDSHIYDMCIVKGLIFSRVDFGAWTIEHIFHFPESFEG